MSLPRDAGHRSEVDDHDVQIVVGEVDGKRAGNDQDGEGGRGAFRRIAEAEEDAEEGAGDGDQGVPRRGRPCGDGAESVADDRAPRPGDFHPLLVPQNFARRVGVAGGAQDPGQLVIRQGGVAATVRRVCIGA